MNEHGIVDGSTYVKSDIWGGKRAANYYLGGDILRIDVCIALDDELMPADYRRIFLSLFKHAMQEYSEKKLLYYFGGEAMNLFIHNNLLMYLKSKIVLQIFYPMLYTISVPV